MTFLSNAFYFIVTLGILVTIHEYGHFWVARKLGVKVLTFSIGFGRPLWQKKGKDGVNYVIAAIPLGGFVKMLDEREKEVPQEELPYAFNRKPVWSRIAIVLAGPVANFILAIFLYWWMFAMGISGSSTQVGKVAEDSIAGQAGIKSGDLITQVDGQPVFLMQDVMEAVVARLGEKSNMVLTVRADGKHSERQVEVPLKKWQVDIEKPDLLGSLGLNHISRDKVIAQVSVISPGGAAEQAGIKKGDIIKRFNQVDVDNWFHLIQLIHPMAKQPAELVIERNGELINKSVVIGSREYEGNVVGSIGITVVWPDLSPYVATRKAGIFESIELAFEKTGKMIALSANLFGKLLTGDISPKSLSGPISIAEGAGGSARVGLVYFISFVAMISVNLGFINLLPVPLLDGGHLLFYTIEAIKGKPLSERIQELGMQIGMMMVFALMAIAVFNDLSRLM